MHVDSLTLRRRIGVTILLGMAPVTAFFALKAWAVYRGLEWEQATAEKIVDVWQRYPLLQSEMIGVAAAGAGALVLLAAVGWLRLQPKKSAYGDDAFATSDDARRMGVFAHAGVLMGKAFGRYLHAAGQASVAVVGPPRSGKTRGIVIPNLLSWGQSAIVTDIKGEIYDATARFRRECGQRVLRYAPLMPGTARYNPLSFIPREPEQRVDQMQLVWNTFIPDLERGERIWSSGARMLAAALTHWILDNGGDPTPGKVYSLVRHTSDIGAWMESQMTDDMGDLSEPTKQGFRMFLAKADKERSGVISTFASAMELFENPLIDTATSATDFDPADFRQQPSTLYIQIAPQDLQRLAPLISLFVQQTLNRLLAEPPRKPDHQILLLMDEFAAFGRMQKILDTVGYLAGYGIVFVPILQNMSQLAEHYKPAGRDAILAAMRHLVFLNINDSQTAEFVSKRMGTKTIESKTKSQAAWGWNMPTVTRAPLAQPLMFSGELQKMNPRTQIILTESQPPIIARKVFYDQDKNLKDRAG